MISRSDARLVHVTTVHKPSDNRIFHKECVALSRSGFDVTLVAVAGRDAEVDGVHLRALPRRRGRLVRALLGPLGAWTQIKRADPSLVHLHDPELIPLGVLWKLLHRTPVVFDAHENLEAQILSKSYLPAWARFPISKFGRLLESLAARCFDGVVVVLPDFVEKFQRAEVVVVQNYPWLQSFPEPKPADESNVFVYVGATTRIRGAHEMMEACARSTYGARVAIVGPLQDDALEVEIGASRNVEYRGTVAPGEIPGIISDSVAGLVLFHPVPNNLVSKPTKLFEYMAAGRPFIASNFSYWRKLVGDDCGLFVDPEDPEAIAWAMDWIISHPEESRQMGMRGRTRFREMFSFDREAEKLVEFVDGLVGTVPVADVV